MTPYWYLAVAVGLAFQSLAILATRERVRLASDVVALVAFVFAVVLSISGLMAW